MGAGTDGAIRSAITSESSEVNFIKAARRPQYLDYSLGARADDIEEFIGFFVL
jgi:hypothetical protein